MNEYEKGKMHSVCVGCGNKKYEHRRQSKFYWKKKLKLVAINNNSPGILFVTLTIFCSRKILWQTKHVRKMRENCKKVKNSPNRPYGIAIIYLLAAFLKNVHPYSKWGSCRSKRNAQSITLENNLSELQR